MKKKPKLSQFERDRIEALLEQGHTQEEIARIIGRDASTISRERARNAHKIRIKGQGCKITDYTPRRITISGSRGMCVGKLFNHSVILIIAHLPPSSNPFIS